MTYIMSITYFSKYSNTMYLCNLKAQWEIIRKCSKIKEQKGQFQLFFISHSCKTSKVDPTRKEVQAGALFAKLF